MCDSGVGEDVAHFLVGYRVFKRGRLVLLDKCVQNCGDQGVGG